ncbi:hypothetical protein [Stenotrophomonas sp. P5_B8]
MISELKEGEHLAEFHLGEHDWLVLSTDRYLTPDQRARVAAHWQKVTSTPGRKAVVLEAGLRLQVLHVKPKGHPDAGGQR